MNTSSLSELSILSGWQRAKVFTKPYPHLVIEHALPDELYQNLERLFPAAEIVTDGREVKDTWYDYPACKVIEDQRISAQWQDFFRYHVSAAFYRELIEKMGEHLRQLHPDLEARLGAPLEDLKVGMRPGGRGEPFAPGADVSMECQFYYNYTRAPRIVRGPHVDRPTELFAALLYFRSDEDDSTGGDLSIEAIRDPATHPETNRLRIDTLPMEIAASKVTPTHTVRYAPNTLVLFLNSAASVHSVTPRSPTPIPRRHINFCADITADLFKLDLPTRLKLKAALARAPGLWRLADRL